MKFSIGPAVKEAVSASIDVVDIAAARDLKASMLRSLENAYGRPFPAFGHVHRAVQAAARTGR